MKHSSPPEFEVAGPSEAVGTALLKLYNAAASAYSARGREEKKKVARWNRSIRDMTAIEDRAAFMGQMGEVMISEISETPTPTVPQGPDPLRYDTKTLNERRAEALAAHLRTTGKSSIKSTEARAVLETIEGRGLDRKAVWRSLRALQGILRASKDIIGGVARLVVPSSSGPRRSPPQEGGSPPFETTGYGSISPRLRRWAVPWDGED
jgi:hypothetical protein